MPMKFMMLVESLLAGSSVFLTEAPVSMDNFLKKAGDLKGLSLFKDSTGKLDLPKFTKFALMDSTSKVEQGGKLLVGDFVATMLGEDEETGLEGVEELIEFSQMEDSDPKKREARRILEKYIQVYQGSTTRG